MRLIPNQLGINFCRMRIKSALGRVARTTCKVVCVASPAQQQEVLVWSTFLYILTYPGQAGMSLNINMVL